MMRQYYNDRGCFHYMPAKNPKHPHQKTCLSTLHDLERWTPQFLTGETIGKFLIIFRLILYCKDYIFALTSFAPEEVCARMIAQIRVFQTTGSSIVEQAAMLPTDRDNLGQGEDDWKDASARYHQTKLLPTLEWKGHVVPTGLSAHELHKDPRILKIPISVIHRLGDQNPEGPRLCEVLVDITFTDPLMNQRDYCVTEDKTATGIAVAASLVSGSKNKTPQPNSGSAGASSSTSTASSAAAAASEPVPGASASTVFSTTPGERISDLMDRNSDTTGKSPPLCPNFIVMLIINCYLI
jgi:hypothetical protein